MSENRFDKARATLGRVMDHFSTWADHMARSMGKEGSLLKQSTNIHRILEKARAGEQIWENDFTTVINATWFLRNGLSVLEDVSPDPTKTKDEKLPISVGRVSLKKRIWRVAQGIAPSLMKEDRKGQTEVELPEFLRGEAGNVYNQAQGADTRGAESAEKNLRHSRRFINGLILSREVQRYGVWNANWDEDVARASIREGTQMSIRNEMAERGEEITEVAVQAELDRRLTPEEMDRQVGLAQEVHKAWAALTPDGRRTLKLVRDLCYAFDVNPDSIVSPDGLTRVNTIDPLARGKKMELTKVVGKGESAREVSVNEISIYDLFNDFIEKARYEVGWAHLNTLADEGKVLYWQGTTIRLHSWRATQEIMEIAGAGLKGVTLDRDNERGQAQIAALLEDCVLRGGDRSRQRFHNLVLFSTMWDRFYRELGVPIKFTDAAEGYGWVEGTEEQLRSYLELDPDMRMATQKLTTEQLDTDTSNTPGTFDYELAQARERGDNRRVVELTRARKRAEQLVKIFMAPLGGWNKNEPAAYQIFNYIYAPGDQKEHLANPLLLAGLRNAHEAGEMVWLEGTNPVTGAQEIYFKSSNNSPGFFVLTLDPKDPNPVARYVETTNGRVSGVLEIRTTPDNDVQNPVYRPISELSPQELRALQFFEQRTNYRKPGWMQPLEEVAGASPWQGIDMGDAMGGVMATSWQVETVQRRVVALARGEMYNRDNPYHRAEIVKYLYRLRTAMGGRGWGLDFKDEFRDSFNGADFNPLNAEHLVAVAAKREGISEEQWRRNWAANHGGVAFDGGLDQDGNAKANTVELLSTLAQPQNWKIEGSEHGLFVDLTTKVWQDKLKSLQFLLSFRFTQARKTFTTLLPAMRGLAPSLISIGGVRYENGVYHGITPASVDKLVQGVYGNLSWWEAHNASQVFRERVNRQMDLDVRELIRARQILHPQLTDLFNKEQLWREAMLTAEEQADFATERHFFRGREITLTTDEIAQFQTRGTTDQAEMYLEKARGIKRANLTPQEVEEVNRIHHRLYNEEIEVSAQEERNQVTMEGKARMIAGKHRRQELKGEVDLLLYSLLATNPSTTVESIYGATYDQLLFYDQVPDFDRYQLSLIEKNPRHLLELKPRGYIERGDPRYRYIQEKLLGGLYDAASRKLVALINLDAFLQRKTQWPLLTGSRAPVNQGLWMNRIVANLGVDNAMELKTQWDFIFESELQGAWGEEKGEGIWQEDAGEHLLIRDGWRRFAKLYLGLDITNVEVVDFAGGDDLRAALTQEFFNDPHRLMQAVYFVDFADPTQTAAAAYEQFYRDVLDLLGDTSPRGAKFAKAPAWWVDFPPITLTKRAQNENGEITTYRETIKVVWDASKAPAAERGVKYVGVRQVAAEAAAKDPIFSYDMIVESIDRETQVRIHNTLTWLDRNIITVDKTAITGEIPDEVKEPVFEFAVRNLSPETVRNWQREHQSATQRKLAEKKILTEMKDYLDPAISSQGLRVFLFSAFGVDIGNQTQFVTQGRINIASIQKLFLTAKGDKFPKLGTRIIGPGLILQNQGIAQFRNGDYEKRRVFRLRHLVGGLGKDGKRQIIKDWYALAKQEIEELARLGYHLETDTYKYRSDQIKKIITTMKDKYGIDMLRDGDPERQRLYASVLGEDWKDPITLEKLERFVTDRDSDEFYEQLVHKINWSKPIGFMSGIARFIGKIGESEKKTDTAADWLKQWVDPNWVGWGMNFLFVAATNFGGWAATVNAFANVIGSTITIGATPEGGILLINAMGNAAGAFLGNIFLPSLVYYIPTGIIGNLISDKIWYKRWRKGHAMSYDHWEHGDYNDITRE